MQEMALARAARAAAEQPGPAAPAQARALEELAMSALDRVLIVRAGTLDALHEALAALERQVPQTGARLVVLDSVAALLRGGELGGGREQVRAFGGVGRCGLGGNGPPPRGAENRSGVARSGWGAY
jgi:RecA/RadA recombinase